ncbi:hypothetical protein CCHR01_01375 [Colletotrichum chrysophilum]|uniref:Uncharacterized protein n=1 Tax=Colletotrichum chrysophilum TaxID=1836956 RepID=A0AAD9EPM3_9PEZI|nr:hypothetical protein CCHR01_01375 [Colletotrichum chrysophilum]
MQIGPPASSKRRRRQPSEFNGPAPGYERAVEGDVAQAMRTWNSVDDSDDNDDDHVTAAISAKIATPGRARPRRATVRAVELSPDFNKRTVYDTLVETLYRLQINTRHNNGPRRVYFNLQQTGSRAQFSLRIMLENHKSNVSKAVEHVSL